MDRQLDRIDSVFKALADATRLRILRLLAAGEVCVCDIHDSLRLPQPKTSRHLAYLRREGLVETRRDGLWVYYRLAEHANPVVRTLVDAALHCLTHVPATARDQRRLVRLAGIDPAESPGVPAGVFACCSRAGRRVGARGRAGPEPHSPGLRP